MYKKSLEIAFEEHHMSDIQKRSVKQRRKKVTQEKLIQKVKEAMEIDIYIILNPNLGGLFSGQFRRREGSQVKLHPPPHHHHHHPQPIPRYPKTSQNYARNFKFGAQVHSHMQFRKINILVARPSRYSLLMSVCACKTNSVVLQKQYLYSRH